MQKISRQHVEEPGRESTETVVVLDALGKHRVLPLDVHVARVANADRDVDFLVDGEVFAELLFKLGLQGHLESIRDDEIPRIRNQLSSLLQDSFSVGDLVPRLYRDDRVKFCVLELCDALEPLDVTFYERGTLDISLRVVYLVCAYVNTVGVTQAKMVLKERYSAPTATTQIKKLNAFE